MGTRRRRTLFVCYFPVGKVLETLGKTRDMRVIFFSKKGERDKRSRRERMKDWGGGGHENKKRGRKGKLCVGKESRVRPSILSWHGCQKALSPGGQREGGGDAARRQLHFSLATRQGYKPAGTAQFRRKFTLP